MHTMVVALPVGHTINIDRSVFSVEIERTETGCVFRVEIERTVTGGGVVYTLDRGLERV